MTDHLTEAAARAREVLKRWDEGEGGAHLPPLSERIETFVAELDEASEDKLGDLFREIRHTISQATIRHLRAGLAEQYCWLGKNPGDFEISLGKGGETLPFSVIGYGTIAELVEELLDEEPSSKYRRLWAEVFRQAARDLEE